MKRLIISMAVTALILSGCTQPEEVKDVTEREVVYKLEDTEYYIEDIPLYVVEKLKYDKAIEITLEERLDKNGINIDWTIFIKPHESEDPLSAKLLVGIKQIAEKTGEDRRDILESIKLEASSRLEE